MGMPEGKQKEQTRTCVAISTRVRLSSLIGPSRSKKTFRIVKLVVDAISPVLSSTASSTRPSAENTRRTNVARREGRFSLNSALDACRSCVAASNLLGKGPEPPKEVS